MRCSREKISGILGLSDGSKTLIKYTSLIVLTVQCAIIPLLIHYTSVRRSKPRYLSTVNVCLFEVFKLLGAFFLLNFQEKSVTRSLKLISISLSDRKETLLVCVPSLIYAVQNNLYFVALRNLDPATFTVIYQMKILVTALFSVTILKKAVSGIQWIALVILTVGVAIVTLQQKQQEKNTHSSAGDLKASEAIVMSRIIGLLAVVTMCLTSGFASVYFEKILKGSDVSVWIQNVRLAVLGIPMNVIILVAKDGQTVYEKGLFYGFDGLIYGMTVLLAAAGLTIAVVMKFADNILKSYAQGISIVIGATASAFLFDFIPTTGFCIGAFLVVGSTVLYGRFPPKKTVTITLNSKELPVEPLPDADGNDTERMSVDEVNAPK